MSTTDTTFKLFRSSDPGFSDTTYAVGEITDILYAALVAGGPSITLTSLVVSSSVATATYSGGHGYSNFGSATVGPVILIAGVTDLTGLNGEKRISVTSSTEFTFDATGVSDGTASGTITAKQAPAGWEVVYSATDKYVFRSQDVASQKALLRIDNSTTTGYALATGWESMTDIDNGTDRFPTVAQSSLGVYIIGAQSGVTSPWILVVTSKAIVFLSDHDGINTTPGGFCWDELENASASNVYSTIIMGGTNAVSVLTLLGSGGLSSYGWLCRNTAGTLKSVVAYRYGPQKSSSASAYREGTEPTVSGFYRVDRRFAYETSTDLTGELTILHSSNLYWVANENPRFQRYYEITTGSSSGQVFLVTENSSSTIGVTIRVA